MSQAETHAAPADETARDEMKGRAFTPDSLGLVIQDVARMLRARFLAGVAADEQVDLTVGEARALVHVSVGEGLRQTAIAERMGVEPMTFCGFVDKLEARGLVERRPHPDDRRAKQVTPTDDGRDALARFAPISRGMIDEATEDLTDEEMRVLRAALTKMRDRLAELTA
ncbi:MarR family winged helix-turn-helix transcriptional regulator [Rhodovulum sp. DZ06]|uniref:MarR family winged helix-turn-helix transcriptional regulator n=1 Tax=Rhodovulum sp. DZ06 TaxID=3425126 RepID=UPI003D3435D9